MTKLISFDYAIKYLLKDKSNYDIVEGFISALLNKKIKIVALLDTESNKEEYSQKKSLADLIVRDTSDQKYIIEIERQEIKNFVHKACFNTSRLIVDHIGAGNDYIGIKKIFHISLLYFKIGNSPIHHGKTIVREIANDERLSIHIEDEETHGIYDATEIFPEYIFISIPQFDDHIHNELDEWLYIMKNEEVKDEFTSPYMQKLAQRLSILNMTTSERDEYYYYMKQLATYSSALDVAEAKGMAKGKVEGKAEEQAKIVKNMLSRSMDNQTIAEITGLSIAEIEKLGVA